MKHTHAGILLLFALPIFSLAQSSDSGVITNRRVVELVQSGVAAEEVLRVIRVAPSATFNLTPADTDKLLKAGVSEETIKIMAAREIYGPALSPRPVQPVPAHAVEPAAVQPGVGVAERSAPNQQQLAPRTDRKSRVFVGETDVFFSSSFSTSSFSAVANRNSAHASGFGVGGSSSGVLKFAINVMKSLNDTCPDKAIIVNNPELADYFLRLERDGRLILSAKMVAFSRAGEMTFVGATHSIGKDVRRFCLTLP